MQLPKARIQWEAKCLVVYDPETNEELAELPFTGRRNPRRDAEDWCAANGYELVLQETRVVH